VVQDVRRWDPQNDCCPY